MMTSKEKQETLARLAASETASLSSVNIGATATSDELAAMIRIIEVLGVPVTQADIVCQNLIRRIRDADLTINFMAYRFFNRTPKGKEIFNKFSEEGAGGGYMTARDDAEEKMFNYSRNGGNTGVQNITNRIRNLGSYSGGNNINFEPQLRPKYAAINYAGLRHGAAGQWEDPTRCLKTILNIIAHFYILIHLILGVERTQRICWLIITIRIA
jgi:hypothetical protein